MALFDQTFVKKDVAQSATPPASPWMELSPDTFRLDELGAATQAALSTAVPSAASIVNGSASSAAESLNNSLKQLLGINGADSAAAKVKAPVKDPIKSAFSKQATPSLNGFITNPTRGTISDLNLGLGNASADMIAQRNPKELQALAGRLGMKVPTNDQELAALTKQAGKVAGATSLTGVFAKGTMLNGIVPGIQSGSGTSISTGEMARYSKFAAKSLGLGGAVGNQVTDELSKTFQSGLPMLADTFGVAIPNLPIDVDPDTLSLLKAVGKTSFGLATDTYCNGAKPFAFLQNLFNGMISLSAKSGILCAMADMLTSDYASHASAQAALRNAIPEVAKKGLSGSVEVISDAIGGGTIPNREDVGRSLIAGGYDNYTMDTIEAAFASMDVTAEQIVSEPNPSDGAAIWNAAKIRASDKSTLDALLEDTTITSMAARANPVAITKWTPANIFR